MRTVFKKPECEDDVDRLIDKLLAEPDRVEDIKSKLRRSLGKDRVVSLRPVSSASDDVDDMWDNVPV